MLGVVNHLDRMKNKAHHQLKEALIGPINSMFG
jgi:hypothetical protein